VDGGSPENFILKECRINPATSISADGFNQDGNYLISYNQDVSTGTVRIYGGYVSPGNFVVDQAQNLYEASVTTPRLLRGNGHLAAVTLDPANDGVAVTQLFMIRCTSATSHTWVVEGSSSGVLATFTGTQTHLPVPSVSPWFYLDFNEGAPAVEDRLMFVFQSSSKDAGKQKSLVFGPSAPSYNGGKSKLTVGPGKNLVLRGTAAEPTTMDRQAGISVYYTVVSSGGLTLDNATVSNVDSNGIQATGAGPVFLASSTFTNLGTDATQRTYMTLSALTSNATFYGMAFNATGGRTNSTSYGIVVQESSPNLRWYFPDAAAGGLIGDADTLQSIRRIYWSDTTPPATPTVFLAVPSATTEGEVALSWTSPGDDGMSLPILGGSFLIFDSTDAATAASAVPGQAQRVIPVVSASTGSSQAFTWDGLRPGATHYFELWAADEWVNNTSTVPASQSAWCPAMTVPALTGLTVGRTIGVALSTAATATFTKPMDLASTAGAVSWTLVKNNLGISTSAAVAFTLSSNTAGNVITIASTAPLAGNGTYVVTVTTAVKDVFGMNLSTSTTLRFTTIMDHTAHNVVTDGLSGATVDVPSNALSVDGYLAAAPAPAGAAAATQKLVANTGDAMRAPVAGGTAAIGALDSGGTPRLFSAPVTVFLAYADADGDGIVDGTSPPLQAKTLTVHWLDEARNLWVPLPTSVDLASRRASAVTPQGAAFALIGQAYTDLSETIAFPTPYRASPGDSGITFSGIGQDATIRIYTVSGRLLREIPISGGNGTYQWDVKNSDGQPVKSGMYYYRVSSGNEVKRGKLAVIR
jgi:hypothetical protein